MYFGYLPLIRYTVCKYCLPTHRMSFHFVDCFLCYTALFLSVSVFLNRHTVNERIYGIQRNVLLLCCSLSCLFLLLLSMLLVSVKKKILLKPTFRSIFPTFFSCTVIVSGLTFRSLIHFRLIF